MIGKYMSDLDPRTWTPPYRIALMLAILLGIALGGLAGLAASEIQAPGLCDATVISD
jgi:hypothetical protein